MADDENSSGNQQSPRQRIVPGGRCQPHSKESVFETLFDRAKTIEQRKAQARELKAQRDKEKEDLEIAQVPHKTAHHEEVDRCCLRLHLDGETRKEKLKEMKEDMDAKRQEDIEASKVKKSKLNDDEEDTDNEPRGLKLYDMWTSKQGEKEKKKQTEKEKEEANKCTLPHNKRVPPPVCGRLYADSVRRTWIKDLARRESDERQARFMQENSVHNNAGPEDACLRLYELAVQRNLSRSVAEQEELSLAESTRRKPVSNDTPDSVRYQWQHQLHDLHKVRTRGIQEKRGQLEYQEIEDQKAKSIHHLDKVNGRRRRPQEIEKTYEQAQWGGAQDDAKPAYWGLRHAGKAIDPSPPILSTPASPMCAAMFAVSPNTATFPGSCVLTPQRPSLDHSRREDIFFVDQSYADRNSPRPRGSGLESIEESPSHTDVSLPLKRRSRQMQSPVLTEKFRIGFHQSSRSSPQSENSMRREVYSPGRDSPAPRTSESGEGGPPARAALSPRRREFLYDDTWANDCRIFASMPSMTVDTTRVPTRIQLMRRGNIGYPLDLEWDAFKHKMACRIQRGWRLAVQNRDEKKLKRMTQAAIVMQRMFRWRRRVFRRNPRISDAYHNTDLEEVITKRARVLSEHHVTESTDTECFRSQSPGQKGWKEYVGRLHREVARYVESVSPRTSISPTPPLEKPKKKKKKAKQGGAKASATAAAYFVARAKAATRTATAKPKAKARISLQPPSTTEAPSPIARGGMIGTYSLQTVKKKPNLLLDRIMSRRN